MGHLVAAAWRGARGFAIHFGSPSSGRVVELPLPLLPIRFHLGLGLWVTPPRITRATGTSWRPWERLLVTLQFVALIGFVVPLIPMRYHSIALDSDGLCVLRSARSMLHRAD